MFSSKFVRCSQEFENLWKPFVRVFQIMCISHFKVFRPGIYSNRTKTTALLMYFCFSVGCHVSLLASTLAQSLQSKFGTKNKYNSPLFFYVNSVGVLGNFAYHLTVHFETIFKGNYEVEIYQKLSEINEIFATKLKHNMDLNGLKRNFLHRIIPIFVFAACLSTASAFIPLPQNTMSKQFIQPILIIAMIIIRGRGCQIALIFNALCAILDDLIVLLKRQQQMCRRKPIERTAESGSCENLIIYYRDIYSHIWLIKNLISDCYGWSLIMFVLQFTFDLINASYWIYINSTGSGSANLTYRMCTNIAATLLSFHFYLFFSFRYNSIHFSNHYRVLVFQHVG